MVVLFLLCTLLFPDDLAEYAGWRDYFQSRRSWFFGIMAVLYVIDFVDTLIKGRRYYHHFGIEYPIRNLAYDRPVPGGDEGATRKPSTAASSCSRSSTSCRWIYRLYDYID